MKQIVTEALAKTIQLNVVGEEWETLSPGLQESFYRYAENALGTLKDISIIKDFSGIALLPEGSIVMDADGIVWEKCDDDLYIPSFVPSESPKIGEDKFPVRVLFVGSEEEVLGSLNDNGYRTSSEDISVTGEVEEPLQETLEGLKSLLADSYAENIELKAENKILKSIIRLRLPISQGDLVEKG